MGELLEKSLTLISKQAKRISALESSLRDCLHLLETAEGYICTDKPQYIPEKATATPDRKVCLMARDGTYFRQTFRDTEAVKRARGLIENEPPAPHP